MSLINRIEDLVKSEINAFLDKAEEMLTVDSETPNKKSLRLRKLVFFTIIIS